MARMKINSKQCATCIFHARLAWDLGKLEAQIADPNMQALQELSDYCTPSMRKRV